MKASLFATLSPTVFLFAAVSGSAANLEFTSVPPFGAPSGVIRGRATAADPAAFKVAVSIFLEGLGWFSKPSCSGNPPIADLTAIQPDGTWSANVVTGGVDAQAILIRADLVPASFTQQCLLGTDGLPATLLAASVAHALIDRPNVDQKVLIFAGRRWRVKSSTVPVGPGPNIFDATNPFVDTSGKLHLRLRRNGNIWTCAEVYLEETLGYGTYQFVIDSQVDALAPNVVLGLFTYSLDPSQSHREIDIEFGFNSSGDATNAQYVLQPFGIPGNLTRFTIPRGLAPTAHQFKWQLGRIDWSSFSGANNLAQHSLTQGIPATADEVTRMNLWLLNGAPPADNRDVEIVISNFIFTPLSGNAPAPHVTRCTNGAGFGTRLAPGGLGTCFGSGFNTQAVAADSVKLPLQLGGSSLLMNGTAVPLYFVSPSQINFQVPYEVQPGTAAVQLHSAAGNSDDLAILVDPAAPGTFIYGASQCLAQNLNGQLNGPGNPAAIGEPVVVYMSGVGLVDNPVATGSPAPLGPLSRPTLAASATLGGVAARLDFLGLTPLLIGVAQANVIVPAGMPLDDQAFIVTMGSISSNPCVLRAGSTAISVPLQISSVSPTSGPTTGGTRLTIIGAGIGNGATVKVGAQAASDVLLVSSSVLQATTPAAAAGTVDIAIANADGAHATLPSAFTYVAGPPVLTSVNPNHGPATGGTRTTLSGSNFRDPLTVRAGSVLATEVTLLSASTAQATMPPGTGTVDVQVVNPDNQSSTLNAAYTYDPPPAGPRLISLNPNRGPATGGTVVAASCANLAVGAQFRFGGVPATSIVVSSSTTAQMTTPPGIVGAVDVQVVNPGGLSDTLRGGFTYGPVSPTITGRLSGCQVSGTVSGLPSSPANFRVVLYALTNQYYLQPCVTEPLQNIDSSGNWGPIDLHSGTIYAVLVRADYNPPLQTGFLPTVDGVNVLAVTDAIGTANACNVARCLAQ